MNQTDLLHEISAIAEHQQTIARLCYVHVSCVKDGALECLLRRLEATAAKTLLLTIKRTQSLQTAGRVSDVLREVLAKYATFLCEEQ
jgi:hypothetical protein